jgi:peptidoglycan/xylan/chitin deacetylase (PgdA/CDA1 family)
MSGAFTLSVDVEGLWGLFFVRSYVKDQRAAKAGRRALPAMLALLEERRMRATFAFVGHLFLDRCGPWKGEAHPGAPRPWYSWYPHDWYGDDPGGDEHSHPLWYARSQALAVAAAGHEVGAHGFAHAILDPSCVPSDVADHEFGAAQRAAATAGLPPLRSFVFPQNVVGHADRLAPAGYACYRESDGGVPARAGPPGGLARAKKLAGHALASAPHVGKAVRREDGVVAVPSSFPLLSRDGLRKAVTRKARVARVTKGLDLAAKQGALLHVWTHPHAFPDDKSLGDLAAVLDAVAARRDKGDVEVLTMAEVADRVP